MSDPKDHHYIPVFYLKRWVNPATGKLIQYSKIREKLISKPVGPKATGFEHLLYSFPDLPPELQHVLEAKFFNGADNLAAKALEQLYARDHQWTADIRSAWSRFIINLYIRHPDPLKEVKQRIRDDWGKTDTITEQEYARAKPEGFPDTFAEYLETLGPGMTARVQLRLVQGALDNERLGQRINNMLWRVIDVSSSPYELLTSDWPADLQLARGMLALPIGPHHLFVAANTEEQMQQVMKARKAKLVAAINLYVVASARRFVWARTENQENFILRHIHTGMRPQPFFPSLTLLAKTSKT
ncbi:MAG: DUF4238 domain-containing protein [Rhizobiales bacterium]|nr:DUF4238 domain-containing protein [Hyphomicrobiales bacterium]